MRPKIVIYVFVSIFVLTCLIFTAPANANEPCDNAELKVIARNSTGNYIGGITYEVNCQIQDVDGNPRPGNRVGGGTISTDLGYGISYINPLGCDRHMIKMYDKHSTVGSFYFYDDFTLSCGEKYTHTNYLSGIKFVFRDTERELRKNTSFTLYTQKYDVDGRPITERQDLVATLNTSEKGEAIIYVAESSRSKEGGEGDYYMFETAGVNGGTYRKWNIRVSDGATTNIEYIFSDLKITITDSSHIPFPAKTRLEIFEQSYDTDGKNALGTKIKDIYTDDYGVAYLEYPQGTYAARVMGDNSQYAYFWDLAITEGLRNSYDLSTAADWTPGAGACEATSKISILTRNLEGQLVPGLSYEIYTQGEDVDGAPTIGAKILSGKLDNNGEAVMNYNPDPRKIHALKLYDINPTVGEFWYFNEFQPICGNDIRIEKTLPAMNIVLRNGHGELKKNHHFSIYTQKFDVDNMPIKERDKLVSSSLTTNETGVATIYLSTDHPFDKEKKGTYIFTSMGENNIEYNEYGLAVSSLKNMNFNYTFSDIVLEVKNALDQPLANVAVTLYRQTKDTKGNYALGALMKSAQTDSHGIVRFEYPSGYYAATVKDSGNKDCVFYRMYIKNRDRQEKTIKTNVIRITALYGDGSPLPENSSINIYSLTEDENSRYAKSALATSAQINPSGTKDITLAEGPYLLAFMHEQKEYGRAIYAENAKLMKLTIHASPSNEILPGIKFTLTKPKSPEPIVKRLKGHLLLQVESHGEAWYVDPVTEKRYYMKDGETAYQMMRSFGLGISSKDINKIPIGINARFNELDTDGDGLHDKLEEALGTSVYNPDSDGDGYDDGHEIAHGYNPLGPGKLPWDRSFADKLRGKIILQVESRGEAWYVSPADGKRYYMKDGNSAYQIMRFLSLGITDENLETIDIGSL